MSEMTAREALKELSDGGERWSLVQIVERELNRLEAEVESLEGRLEDAEAALAERDDW